MNLSRVYIFVQQVFIEPHHTSSQLREDYAVLGLQADGDLLFHRTDLRKEVNHEETLRINSNVILLIVLM